MKESLEGARRPILDDSLIGDVFLALGGMLKVDWIILLFDDFFIAGKTHRNTTIWGEGVSFVGGYVFQWVDIFFIAVGQILYPS